MAALEPQTLSAASSCEGKDVWCPDRLVGSWPREGGLFRSFSSSSPLPPPGPQGIWAWLPKEKAEAPWVGGAYLLGIWEERGPSMEKATLFKDRGFFSRISPSFDSAVAHARDGQTVTA